MRGLPALALVLLVLPLASAAPATAELRVAPPLVLQGDVRLSAEEGVLVLPALASMAASAERVNVTLLRVQAPAEAGRGLLDGLRGLVPASRGDWEGGVRYLEMERPQELVVSVREAGARAVLAVGPFDAGRLVLQGGEARVRGAVPQDLGALPAELADARGPWLAAQGHGDARLVGTVRGLFEGVGLVLQNATGALQVDALHDARGARWLALVRWSGATLEPRAEAATLLAPRLEVALQGALSAARAWGPLTLEDRAHGAQGQSVLARGAMEGTLEPEGGALRMRMQGDIAYLAVGGAERDVAQAAAASLGVALLGALAYYANHLRFLAAPLYARIAGDELLDNDVRRRVHGHITMQPGADVKGTAEAVGVSWSTAAYHLARLEREGVLVSRRSGRSKRFFLNGAAAHGRAEAIAALRNPTALAIAELVARRPGLMQKEIGAALGLPPSTVSWHMRRLRVLGVVLEQRHWRRAEYAAGPAWDELRPALGAGLRVAPPPSAQPAPT